MKNYCIVGDISLIGLAETYLRNKQRTTHEEFDEVDILVVARKIRNKLESNGRYQKPKVIYHKDYWEVEEKMFV